MLHCKFPTIPLLLVALFFGACSQNKEHETKKTPPPLAVNTITIKTQQVPIWKHYTGRTRASSHQDVVARVTGTLEKVYFKDGAWVKKGQKLFKIEQSLYIAALDGAIAKKKQDLAEFALAKADVARYAPLVKEGLAPRATLEQYQAKLSGLRATVLGDNAKIQEARTELNYTIIKSPISGKVSARMVDVGNLVGPGNKTLLTTVVQTNPLYAYFSPSQDDVRVMQKYADTNKPYASIELNSKIGKLGLKGYVDFANNSVDPETSTISMRATIENPEYKILPGTFVNIDIFISNKYQFKMIPPEIIFHDQLGKFVYIVDKNNTLQRADITTGYDSKYYVSVQSGLKDGDKVVVSGFMKLKPNIKVKATDVTDKVGVNAIIKKYNLNPTHK